MQHDDIVGLRQSLEDAGKPLAAACLNWAKPPDLRRDHLERRLFIHMDDVVEAGSSGGEARQSPARAEAELVRHGVRPTRQIDQDPEPLLREQRPRDGNGLAARVDLRARGHDEDGAWRVLLGEKLKVIENRIERGERMRGGSTAIGMLGRRRAVSAPAPCQEPGFPGQIFANSCGDRWPPAVTAVRRHLFFVGRKRIPLRQVERFHGFPTQANSEDRMPSPAGSIRAPARN